MANRYWVTGGTGNWNSTTNWSTASGGASGASVPGSSDIALLDAASGAGTVTLDISPTVQALTCTGFTGTLAFSTNTISLNSTGTIFTGVTTMSVTGTPLIICTNATATLRTLSPAAVTEANSISFRIIAGTGSLTTNTGAYRDLDFTDGVNPTGFAGIISSNSISIFGNLKASTGMTVTAGTGTITFAATSGTKTINTAGVTFDRPFTFSGVGGTFQLQAALTSGATRTLTLNNGTLNLNNYTITIGGFSATNSNTRTLAFGTGKLVLTTNNTTVSNTSTGTGLTVTGSKRVELYYTGSVGTRAILGATTATVIEGVNLLDYYITAGSDIIQLSGVRTYGNLDFSDGGTSTFTGSWLNSTNTTTLYGNLILNTAMSVGGGTFTVSMRSTSSTKTITSAGKTLDFPVTFDGIGGTWTCTDALTLGSTQTLTMTNGTLQLKSGTTSTIGAFATSGTNQKYLQSTTAGSQATISDASGINTVSYLTIQDSYATGGADWDTTQPTNINAGNNRGWSFASGNMFLLF